MIDLLKYTYLMDLKEIENSLNRLWATYKSILENPNWVDMNRARAILYLTGQIYCEKIAPQAIERRLLHLKEPMDINEFLLLVDTNSERLKELREKDETFKTLEAYYRIIKNFKNKHTGGKYYLDEEKFIDAYNKCAKTDLEKTSYRGIVELKKKENKKE